MHIPSAGSPDTSGERNNPTATRAAPNHRRLHRAVLVGVLAVMSILFCPTVFTPPARADSVAYLVNVTVRPGYNFANADEALHYGYALCDRIAAGIPYKQVMGDVKRDFQTADEYQTSYLISQAANELCPQFVWQLRRSAAGYQPPKG
jgi:hypothetical protein